MFCLIFVNRLFHNILYIAKSCNKYFIYLFFFFIKYLYLQLSTTRKLNEHTISDLIIITCFFFYKH